MSKKKKCESCDFCLFPDEATRLDYTNDTAYCVKGAVEIDVHDDACPTYIERGPNSDSWSVIDDARR